MKKDIINTCSISEKDLEYEVFKEKRDAPPKAENNKQRNKNKNYKQFKNTKKDEWQKGQEGAFKRSDKTVKGKGENEELL